MQHLPIHPSMRHPLTGEPLRAVYVDKHGTPRYPIMGGSEDADADGAGDAASDADAANDAGDSGDGDKDAENRMLIDERNGRKSAETLLAELTGKSKLEIRRLLKDPAKAREALTAKPDGTTANKGDKPEVDEAEIRAEAQREADAKANARIVRAEVRALAADTFANPADALHNLDLDDFEVNEDGELENAEAVKKALADVLKKNPHYAKKGKAPKPDPSQGNRGDTKPEATAGIGRLRAAYADSSK